MNALLALSRAIDALSERIGRVIYWFVLVVVLISAANATIRKIFNYSSNAYLEIQWYLFSVIFLFGAGYVLLHNAHVLAPIGHIEAAGMPQHVRVDVGQPAGRADRREHLAEARRGHRSAALVHKDEPAARLLRPLQ